MNARRKPQDTTPRVKRKRPLVTLSLSPEARAQLEELSAKAGQPASRLVERWIRAAYGRAC